MLSQIIINVKKAYKTQIFLRLVCHDYQSSFSSLLKQEKPATLRQYADLGTQSFQAENWNNI